MKLAAVAFSVLAASACAGPPPKPAAALVPDAPADSGAAAPPEPEPATQPAAEKPAPAAKPKEDPGAAALASVQSAAIPAGFQISLERTECFGTCPAYTVTIRGNGDVSFVGSSPTAGCLKRTAPVKDVGKLVALVNAADFFRLKPRYWAAVTDHPWAHVEVRSGGRTKRVEHYLADSYAHGDERDVKQREGLRALEAAIDTVTGAQDLANAGPLLPCK